MDRGIHILNFYDDKTDTELKYLGEVLDQMKPFMDVGEFLERNFGFQRFYDYL
jgi:regulator of sigma D